MHLIGGLIATALVVWHLAIIMVRHLRQAAGEKAGRMRAAQGVFLWRTAVILVLTGLVTTVWVMRAPTTALATDFPADYQLPYGESPFAPSLATTASGGALVAQPLGNSERCGDVGCHTEIVEEWLPSAHRYSSMSPFFQGVQAAMAANNGPESTRYCGGCHDPIALFSGLKNLYSDDLSGIGAQQGVSCVVCHSIESTDVRGNANYVVAAQPRYLHELSEQPLASWAGRFLIRAYPRQHVNSFSRSLYRTPEYCGACHKQFIDEEINNVGWVQLQNQYDTWRQSRWHAPDDVESTITCRECHMAPGRFERPPPAAISTTTIAPATTASTAAISSSPPTSTCRRCSSFPVPRSMSLSPNFGCGARSRFPRSPTNGRVDRQCRWRSSPRR